MSLHALSHSHTHLNARAGHNHAVRHVNAHVEIEERSQVHEKKAEQDSFVDVVARQLSAGSSFEAVAKRASRTKDDDYVGPIDLDQDEFANRPTRVRRQAPSNIVAPGTGSGSSTWANGDVGTMQALFPDGTFKNIMVGNVVYATEGSDDGTFKGAVPLQAQIVTPNGGPIVAGTLFALQDFLAVYVSPGQAKPWIGVSTSSNPGMNWWLSPQTIVANLWSIDPVTGILTATYQDSILQWGINDNTTPYPGSLYSGNGDADAMPASGTMSSTHQAAVLRLVKS